MKMHRAFLLLIIIVFLGTGCTALNTFPQSARLGDTIALAVGSPDGMTKANTTATFTSDSDGIPVDITTSIRSIFKLYADKASKVYDSGSAAQNIIATSGHEPWVTIVALNLPTTGLQLGPGDVRFNTTATYPTIGSHINDLSIALDILPSAGIVSDFAYEFGVGTTAIGDLNKLKARTQAVVGPSFPSSFCSSCPYYAAIEVKINMPNSKGTALSQELLRVLPEDLTMETGSGRGVIYGVTGGENLTVLFISPTGQLQYYEARFSIVPDKSVTLNGTPTVTSVRYFDIDGNEIAGPVSDYIVSLQ